MPRRLDCSAAGLPAAVRRPPIELRDPATCNPSFLPSRGTPQAVITRPLACNYRSSPNENANKNRRGTQPPTSSVRQRLTTLAIRLPSLDLAIGCVRGANCPRFVRTEIASDENAVTHTMRTAHVSPHVKIGVSRNRLTTASDPRGALASPRRKPGRHVMTRSRQPFT